MPYERHQVVVATGDDDKDRRAIIDFRDTMPPEIQHLLAGPVEAANGYWSFALFPDGSGIGYPYSNLCAEWRHKLLDLLLHTTCDWVHVHMTEDSGEIADENGKRQIFQPHIIDSRYTSWE
jgi:hypothetical protein